MTLFTGLVGDRLTIFRIFSFCLQGNGMEDLLVSHFCVELSVVVLWSVFLGNAGRWDLL